MSETGINKGGRPRIDATPVTIRVPPDMLAALDALIAQQPDPKPSRPEAMRQILAGALDVTPRDPVKIIKELQDAARVVSATRDERLKTMFLGRVKDLQRIVRDEL